MLLRWYQIYFDGGSLDQSFLGFVEEGHLKPGIPDNCSYGLCLLVEENEGGKFGDFEGVAEGFDSGI
jgi:hypothetical protein